MPSPHSSLCTEYLKNDTFFAKKSLNRFSIAIFFVNNGEKNILKSTLHIIFLLFWYKRIRNPMQWLVGWLVASSKASAVGKHARGSRQSDRLAAGRTKLCHWASRVSSLCAKRKYYFFSILPLLTNLPETHRKI